jgi:hypothetical protein
MSADDAALGALGVTCRVRCSCADAGSAQATASSEISSDRWIAFMDRSVECGGEADAAGALSRSDSIENHPATRNPESVRLRAADPSDATRDSGNG